MLSLCVLARQQVSAHWIQRYHGMDLATGHCAQTLARGPESSVLAVAWSPAAAAIASGDSVGCLLIWDAPTGTVTTPSHFFKHPGSIFAVAFSPNGTMLATSCTDGQVRLFAWKGFSLIHAFNAHERETKMWALAFSPITPSLLATGGSDKTVKLWDVSDPRKPRLVHTFTGFGETVYTVAFSCDGTLLATSCRDHTVRLWRTDTYQLQRTLTAHTSYVFGAAFHPQQNNLLVTSSNDETARLWLL